MWVCSSLVTSIHNELPWSFHLDLPPAVGSSSLYGELLFTINTSAWPVGLSQLVKYRLPRLQWPRPAILLPPQPHPIPAPPVWLAAAAGGGWFFSWLIPSVHRHSAGVMCSAAASLFSARPWGAFGLSASASPLSAEATVRSATCACN